MSNAQYKNSNRVLNIAVIGTGISGMAAAWLLARKHSVTIYEKEDRLGGHSNTVIVNNSHDPLAVDTGFIVYNERTYPNLTALFRHLEVPTQATDMSFSASLDGGRFEYSGSGLSGLLAQPQNLLRPRLWLMLKDLLRFYRQASQDSTRPELENMSLGDYLNLKDYSTTFLHDHLLPMGAAIWSTPVRDMLDYPLVSFVRFCDNHGLLQLTKRPTWRTVVGGSRTYVKKLTANYTDNILLGTGVKTIWRNDNGAWVEDGQGEIRQFDHVVIATHADQALTLLKDADSAERRLLSAFRYEHNIAILHKDSGLMPRHRRAWASWNFLSGYGDDGQKASVTYWMNRLQRLPEEYPLFMSLNPPTQPQQGSILRSFLYEHPLYDNQAMSAQRMLWNLQGARRTWYCGAYFGHGFHEDGLQAGLAVAEQLGGLQRPWDVPEPNGRIHCQQSKVRHIDTMAAA
jgi:predicted NAD/FAD-binding protein